ncbi:MAG: PAS domain S-box protein, partial [Planctomycetes bacterium]|nr:PAS domain S-box protein [Planctomycetota bacterium]
MESQQVDSQVIEAPIDGGLVFFRTDLIPLHYDGKDAVLSVSTDITDIIEAQKALEESESLFSEMFLQSKTASQLFDTKGNLLKTNSEFDRIFGVDGEDMLKAEFNILDDPTVIKHNILPELKRTFENRKVGKWTIDFDIQQAADDYGLISTHPDKMWIDAVCSPILNIVGELEYVVIQYHDITEARNTVDTLNESERFFSQMFEQSIVSTQLLDPEGNTVRVNPPFCELFGVTPEDMKYYKIFEDEAAKHSGGNGNEPLLDVFNNK